MRVTLWIAFAALAVNSIGSASGQAARSRASQDSQGQQLRDFHELARMIEGQQAVLAQSKRDLAQAERELAGKTPEQVLGEAPDKLAKIARDQAKLATDGRPTGNTVGGIGRQVKAGVRTVRNFNNVINFDRDYWARIEAVQRATQQRSRAERRVQTARTNLSSAYLALLLTIGGTPATSAQNVSDTLKRLDANSRRLGLGPALSGPRGRSGSASRADRGTQREGGDPMGDRRGGSNGGGGTGASGGRDVGSVSVGGRNEGGFSDDDGRGGELITPK